MTIKLFKLGVKDPIKVFSNRERSRCAKVRNNWIREVKNLKGSYYIDILPTDIKVDLNKFEELLNNKRNGKKETGYDTGRKKGVQIGVPTSVLPIAQRRNKSIQKGIHEGIL